MANIGKRITNKLPDTCPKCGSKYLAYEEAHDGEEEGVPTYIDMMWCVNCGLRIENIYKYERTEWYE